MKPVWLRTDDLANLAGLTRRGARKAAQLALSGSSSWRGTKLDVRESRGRGGRSGIRFEVRLDSLPPDLQLAWKALQAQFERPAKHDDESAIEREWRFGIIRPALGLKPNSEERRRAVVTIAAQDYVNWRGVRVPVDERTVYRWLARYDALGLDGLTRRKRADAGRSKVILTREWDRAVDCYDAERERIAAKIRHTIRQYWASGGGYSVVSDLASRALMDLTRPHFRGTHDELKAICRLPRNLVESENDARAVHEYLHNRKAYEDKRQRIVRTTEGLAPMQVVFGDVHHVDRLVRREDGSLATPKMIGWFDAATRRFRADWVLCEPNSAVRNADTIQSFINMTEDPEWGVPGALYLDNGSEYRFADFARDAVKLAGMECHVINGRDDPIIRAEAYNGPAKGLIEGFFANFERTILATLEGYMGGDRMKTRSGNVGKPPKPYDGSFEAFIEEGNGLIAYYNCRVQTRQIKGRSPNELFRGAVERGWQRTDIDLDALLTAFSEETTRKVSDGKISVEGMLYCCDELIGLNGLKITIRIPKYTTWDGVPFYDRNGNFVAVALPERVHDLLSPEGAKEAARRKRLSAQTAKAQVRETQPIDLAPLMIAAARAEPPAPIPESAGIIRLSEAAEATGKALAETPAERRSREHEAAQAHQEKRAARYKRFLAERGQRHHG